MPSRGLFGRLLDWFGDRTPGKPTAPPAPPTEPPREPPGPSSVSPHGGGPGPNQFRQTWNTLVDRRQIRRISEATGYSANEIFQHHVELFFSLPGIIDEDRDEQLRLWNVYIEYMVTGTERRNSISNPFWSEFGLDPRANDFDWGEWRDAMGYSRRG